MQQDTVDIIVRFFVLTVSLSIHEFSHAWAAYRLGDDTAARMGRMTINPLVHLDIMGSLMILFGMPLGWAKPVPVDVGRLRDPRRDGSLVALAGPVSNIILGILFCVAFSFLGFRGFGWYRLLTFFIQVNFGLAIFNLLPLYPLDGSKVLPLFLSRKAADRYDEMISKWGIWPLGILFLPAILGFKGPLNLWFALWSPVLRPLLNLFGVPEFW